MVQIEHLEYTSIAKKFLDKPFEVTNAWVRYQKEKGNQVLFFVDSKVQPQILCWARIKNVKFLGSVLDLFGPVYKDSVTFKQLYKFLNKIKDLPYEGVLLNLATEYSVVFEEACRRAMFKRPIGQTYTTLSIKVNTSKFNPDRGWKRNIKKAKGIDFRFEVKQNISKEDAKLIEALHRENSKLKKLNFNLDADQVYTLTQEDNTKVCFLYRNDTPIAARIITIEETISYDVYACNSLESRNNGASQYLMQKIFEYLRNNGVSYFDFSRIPVGKIEAKGVYDFKKSSRGEVVHYNGEWVYFKNKKLRHLYYFYNLVIKKKAFY